MQRLKDIFLNIYNKIFSNKNNNYASFSKRFASFIVDTIIILIIFNLSIYSLSYFGYDFNINKQKAITENIGTEKEKVVLINTIDEESFRKSYKLAIFISALYYTILISSKKQATIGNIIFKIMVIDIKHGRVSILTSLLRYISLIINNTLYGFGYIIYFYRKDRAFLQDLLSNTRVINLIEQNNDTSAKK